MAEHNVALEGTGASRADRRSSFVSADFPMPSGKEEEWRFTPLERMAEFLSGAMNAHDAPVAARGGKLEKVGRDDPRIGQVAMPDDRSAALAWEAFDEAHVLTLAGSEHEEVFVDIAANEGMNAAHLAIVAEPGAKATVVVSHTGIADLAETVEVSVGEGADIAVVSIQEGERTARHLSAQRVRVAKDANLRHIVVTLGGDLVRVSTSVAFTGKNGNAELLGAYITDAGEHQEHRLFVNHGPANCVSRVTYKGALQGEDAHSVWIGDVLIDATAENTDTYELNRNLVLTRGAKTDSVPNLEIKTGKIVGAGHASATGRFDEEQLFYLMARGIPADVARRLVVRGFFAEMIENIGIESVQARLMAAIESELNLDSAEGAEH